MEPDGCPGRNHCRHRRLTCITARNAAIIGDENARFALPPYLERERRNGNASSFYTDKAPQG